MVHSHLVWAFLALAATSTALPRPDLADTIMGPFLQKETCQDVQNRQTKDGQQFITANYWDSHAASGLITSFCSDSKTKDACNNNFAPSFASQWGMGQSFSCKIDAPCKRPDCTSLQNKNAEKSGAAMMVLVSISNFNNYLNALKNAVTMSQTAFATLQTSLQQKYWPNIKPDTQTITQVLNGFITAVGVIAAAAGGQVAAETKEITNGMLNAASKAIKDKQDDPVAKIAKMSQNEFDTWYKPLIDSIYKDNDALVQTGRVGDRDAAAIFKGGAWLDYRDHPVLNDDKRKMIVSSTDLNDLMYSFILGSAINYAWKQQAVYLVSYEMSEAEFKSFKTPSGNNDARLKHYVAGRGYFFQSIFNNQNIPKSRDPPGWAEIEKDTKHFDLHAIIQSSAEGYNKGGMNYNSDDHAADFSDEKDMQSLFNRGPNQPGFFNIPICQLQKSHAKNLKELADIINPGGLEFVPNNHKSRYVLLVGCKA